MIMPREARQPPLDLESMMRAVRARVERDAKPSEDDPIGRLTREMFASNWAECRDGLLAKTTRIRITPELSPAPRAFRFEIDCPYKRKLGGDAPVQWMPGPVLGEIIYRADLFQDPDGPCLAVFIDRELGYFHPNHSRERGYLCIGELNDLPPGPIPLDLLLENHLFPIISYQNRRPSHPADLEAARYFALDPTAMEGLEPVVPLY
jgi:hypothetical protein